MSQQIVRPEDFKTPPGVHQIQGIIYRGEGSPVGQRSSPKLGAIYVDYIAGNIWTCSIINDVTGWQPFYSALKTGISIDTDVQEGDFIGIYGPGAWSNASAALNVTREFPVSGGCEFSAWAAGGQNAIAAFSSTETFNGTSWSISAASLLTAPPTPGSGNLLNLNGAGSQSAAWALGGTNFAGTAYSFMQVFNGDAWSNTSINGLTASAYAASNGTLNSAWHMQGFAGLVGEYFNGSVWARIPANGIFITVGGNKGIGSSNSHFACGGAPSTSSSAYSYTFFYNGYAYFVGNSLNAPRAGHQASGNTLNALISGGTSDLGGGAGTYLTTSEFYNGCTWGAGNPLSISARARGANAGSRNMGIVAGGTTDGTTKLNTTEMHAQTTYRKMNFTRAMGAMNIGTAYGVVNASNTATLMTGDVVSHRLPYRKFFGLNRHQHYSATFYLEAARTVTSITAIAGGTATVVLGTSNTEITKGMLLEVSGSATVANNGLFPVVGVTNGTTLTIKNPNAVTQGASGNAQLVWGNRIVGLPTADITVSGNNVTFNFNLTGTITGNTFLRLITKNSILYVPYASTSGAAGSQYNFGSYVINSITGTTVVCSKIHSQHVTETIACTSTEILNHSIAKDVAEAEDYIFGFNNRMNLITNTSNDTAFERW